MNSDESVPQPTTTTMKTYVGTKLLQAEPMTRGEYNAHRGWEPPADEDQAVAGYHVVYADGYQSWLPAPQFEEAYVELQDVDNLAPHQVRVVAELAELKKKLIALRWFISNRSETTFSTLDTAEQTRLVMQQTIMDQYAQLLSQRIADFKVQS